MLPGEEARQRESVSVIEWLNTESEGHGDKKLTELNDCRVFLGSGQSEWGGSTIIVSKKKNDIYVGAYIMKLLYVFIWFCLFVFYLFFWLFGRNCPSTRFGH